jgi:hypothetical protein
MLPRRLKDVLAICEFWQVPHNQFANAGKMVNPADRSMLRLDHVASAGKMILHLNIPGDHTILHLAWNSRSTRVLCASFSVASGGHRRVS